MVKGVGTVQPSGLNPDMDARQNVLIMFKAAEVGRFINILQVFLNPKP